ncbi:MAG: hypothetical protein WCG85_05865 [Polyangia bacterium]
MTSTTFKLQKILIRDVANSAIMLNSATEGLLDTASKLTEIGDEEVLRMVAKVLLTNLTLAEARVDSCLKDMTSARERLEAALTPNR